MRLGDDPWRSDSSPRPTWVSTYPPSGIAKGRLFIKRMGYQWGGSHKGFPPRFSPDSAGASCQPDRGMPPGHEPRAPVGLHRHLRGRRSPRLLSGPASASPGFRRSSACFRTPRALRGPTRFPEGIAQDHRFRVGSLLRHPDGGVLPDERLVSLRLCLQTRRASCGSFRASRHP